MNNTIDNVGTNNVVLLVDDQENIRLNLKQWLERSYFQVHAAETIEEADKIINSYKLNYAIVDLKLDFKSDYGGVEIVNRVKEHYPQCKVIVLSAYDFTEEIKREIRGNYDDFVSKGAPKNYIKAVLDTLKDLNPSHFSKLYKIETKKKEYDILGFYLNRKLKGHRGAITRISWSPDGSKIVSGATDKAIRIWNTQTGDCLRGIEEAHSNWIWCVAWSPKGNFLASASEDGAVYIWNSLKDEFFQKLILEGKPVYTLSWSYDGKFLAAGSYDGRIQIWQAETWDVLHTLNCSNFGINCLAWSPKSYALASGGYDQIIRVWDGKDGKLSREYVGHNACINSIAWSPDADKLVSGGDDRLIKIWDTESKRNLWNIEGHTDIITTVSFSPDGRFLSSRSRDCTVRCWQSNNWAEVAKIGEQGCGIPTIDWHAGLSFNPKDKQPILATLGQSDTEIFLWNIDFRTLYESSHPSENVSYTTAKIAIVGDSGVGKTGLGYRIAEKKFKEHPSTHGMNFWLIDELRTTRPDGTECEALLWDTAGQHIYRPVNAIFLDNVDVALVVFDSTNRVNPLKGVEFWLQQLSGKHDLPSTILVGARVDRGGSFLSQQELNEFCKEYKISGGYVETSAKKDIGIETLIGLLMDQIPWNKLATTVTTSTFKRIKELVLSKKKTILKDKTEDEWSVVLVSPSNLRKDLEATDPSWKFTDEEMMTAVKHLENHGHVMVLQGALGAESILLTPDLIATLASSIVLKASNHPRELGALNEKKLLQGHYNFFELDGLKPAEQEIIVDATLSRFLEHNVCFREFFEETTLLIFPGLIKQKRPHIDEIQKVDTITYIVGGAVENVYAAIVVLIGYSQLFKRVNQWQNEAQYLAQFESGAGEICGFRLIEEREGEIELTLYYGSTTPEHNRTLFQGLFEKFLFERDVEVNRYPPVFCSKSHQQERILVFKHLREKKKFLFCHECGERIALPEVEKPRFLGRKLSSEIDQAQAYARIRNLYETHLSTVKRIHRDKPAPICYISYLDAPTELIKSLTHDLREAGVGVLEDRNQIFNIKTDIFIVLTCTPEYKIAWERGQGPIAYDATLIKNHRNISVIPLLLEGEFKTSCPTEFHEYEAGDFRDKAYYMYRFFELVLTLYSIPLNHSYIKLKIEDLKKQCKMTLVDADNHKFKIVDQSTKRFLVALSFPGEYRELVKTIAEDLSNKIGKERVFYDEYYKEELARPNLDIYLQDIYNNNTELIVIFLCKEYTKKEWCGLEWRAIRNLIKKKQDSRIMPIRLDDAKIQGFFPIDGYLNAVKLPESEEVADLIIKRIDTIKNNEIQGNKGGQG